MLLLISLKNYITKNSNLNKFLVVRFLFFFILLSFISRTNGQSFEVYADNNRVEVYEQNDIPLDLGLSAYKFVRIPYNGSSIDINIKVRDFEFKNTDWTISPKSYNLNGIKSGNSLSFSINRLGYVVVIFRQNQDFTKRIVLLFEKPEFIPENRVDIVDTYGVDNTGNKNETSKIQKALDEISGSRKVLYFPPGVYKTFTLQFRSNSQIYLAKNARILADDSTLSHYISDDETGINRFLLIKNIENLSISGLGTLDGNGTQILAVSHAELPKNIKEIRLLFIYNSKNININGVLLKDSARWNTHILKSESVSFRHCKLMNNPIENKYLGSLDGWDPDSSSDILIESCFGWAGDDAVAIKCTGHGSPLGKVPNAENITVRDNVFLTKKSGLKIGTETFCSKMQNILFDNNDIIESDRVMGINVRDGAIVQDVVFRDNHAELSFPDRKQNGMNFYITKRDRNISKLGKIQKIIIENCSFDMAFPKKFAFFRHYPETLETDLSIIFKNLIVAGEKVEDLNPKFFDLSKNNAQLIFKDLKP